MTKPNKEWTESVVKKAPVCKTSYEVMCADMLIHFGRAVECVKYEQLKISTRCENPNMPCDRRTCKGCGYEKHYGLPIHIARIFVSYCGWVKGNELGCNTRGFYNNLLTDITVLLYSIICVEFVDVSGNFIEFCKAHKIDLVSAVEIVLREGE